MTNHTTRTSSRTSCTSQMIHSERVGVVHLGVLLPVHPAAHTMITSSCCFAKMGRELGDGREVLAPGRPAIHGVSPAITRAATWARVLCGVLAMASLRGVQSLALDREPLSLTDQLAGKFHP
jgi:hypothetical protein